jgi:peptidoglycan/LPS O-acetylase OafA/YrhL
MVSTAPSPVPGRVELPLARQQPLQGQSGRRNVAIDVLRGVAILAVANDHFQDMFKDYATQPSSFVQIFFDYCGWVGVDLFFVLSGFLVSGLLFQEYRQKGRVSPGRFLIRRGFKIYPGFYCFLFVLVAFKLIGGLHSSPFVWQEFLAEAFFVQNYFKGMAGITWSLAVEEHFYVGLALVLYLASRTEILHRRRLFLGLGFGVILLVFCLRLVNALHSPTANIMTGHFLLGPQYYASHLRLDGLLFGVMLSYLYHFEHGRTRHFCERWRAVLIPLGLLVVVVVAPWPSIEQVSLYPSNSFWVGTIGFTLLYLGWGAVLMGAIALPAGAWSNPVARIGAWIGLYSYSIYLWHDDLATLTARLLDRWHLIAYPHAAMAGFIVIAVLVGYLVAKAIEMPMLALRDRLFPR